MLRDLTPPNVIIINDDDCSFDNLQHGYLVLHDMITNIQEEEATVGLFISQVCLLQSAFSQSFKVDTPASKPSFL